MKVSFISLLSSAWLIGILLPLMIPKVQSAPFFLLTNSRPKCVTVKAPRMSTLLINYSAPDMSDMSIDDSEQDKKTMDKEKQQEGLTDLDSRYKQRRDQKMEQMQRASKLMKDFSITVTQKNRRDDPKLSRARPNAGTGRLRQDLTAKSGLIEYETGSFDGDVDICIQSIAAQSTSPSRLSVLVDLEHTQIYEEQKKKQAEKEKGEEKKSSADEAQRRAERHMTKMESELMQLNRKMENILSNADYAKEQEVQFHEQSLAMNSASQYWPMLHLLVLMITGFTQASHIVRFFKSRHIM